MLSENDEKNAFNMYKMEKICKSELSSRGICRGELAGYTKERLRGFIEQPAGHSKQLISVIRFIYFHSGYFKKIIQYYMNLVKSDCWTVDMEVLTPNAMGVSKTKVKKDYLKYLNEVRSFGLENELSKILFSVLMYDAYFGFIVETDEGKVLFSFPPEDCVITGYVNGIPCFAVRNLSAYNNDHSIYPPEVQKIFREAENRKDRGVKSGYVQMPYDKTICIKFNDGFDYLMPPFAFMIKDILDIEDFGDIDKAIAENGAYKIIALKVPTNDNGIPTMSEKDCEPWYDLVGGVVSENIGILPTPFETNAIKFDTNSADDINNTKNAIDKMYSELGVSQALTAGASSGSELKTSIEVDASDMYRILRQIARAVNFHCHIRLASPLHYRFSFRYLDITAFNQSDKVDELMKMAQASCPVKTELMAASGNNPLKMFGNAFLENDVFELSDKWEPMKTAYTQSGEDEGGRPEMDENEISEITQNTRDNDGNDKDNRV